MLNWFARLLMFFGRIFLGIIFLWAAFDKIINYHVYTEMVASKGINEVSLFVIGSGIVEFLGAIALIFGYWTRFGAFVLMVYLIPTTFIFHDFWIVATTGSSHIQTILFLKNLGLFAGLLYVFSCGAGLLAFDNYKHYKVDSVEDEE